MTRQHLPHSREFIFALLIVVTVPGCSMAQPAPPAISVFNTYIAAVELRLAQQHRSQTAFLAPTSPFSQNRLRHGELVVEQLTPSAGADLPGALLHHWRGTAFADGASASDLERLLRNFNAYPRHFSPQVVQATVLAQQGDHLQVAMRVRQQHVITVVLDTTYQVDFASLDSQHRYSLSRSTRISEIASPGTAAEHALNASEEHGFLWRQNTYWSYEERDGGLYLQIESVSLTRSIPAGLGWAVRPFVERVPRDSLEFTLRSALTALDSDLRIEHRSSKGQQP
jgi:hypothetical protein